MHILLRTLLQPLLLPVATPVPPTPPARRRTGVGAGLAAIACAASLALPATAQVVRFGHGGRHSTTTCLTKNTQFTTNTTLPTTDAWIFLRVTAPAGGLSVSGFRLLLRSTSGAAVTVPTRLLDATASNTPGTTLAHGSPVFVGTVQRLCPTWFATHNFAAGAVFFIAYQNPASGVSLGGTASSAGVNVNWFYRPTGGAMSGVQVAKWKYEIICGGATPNCGVLTQPVHGTTFTWNTDNVPPGEDAIPFYGVSNTQGIIFGSLQSLPYDLTQVGAPQCKVFVSPDLFGQGYPAAGGTWQTDLPLAPSLAGFTFYCQWVVGATGANPLGVVTSDALRVTVM